MAGLLGRELICIGLQGRPKAGDHRAHIACHSGLRTHTYSITLSKDTRSRAEEERVAAEAILSVIGHHCGVQDDAIPWWPLAQRGSIADKFESSLAYDLPNLHERNGKRAASRTEGGTDGKAVAQDAAVEALLAGKVQCVEVSGPSDARRVVVDGPRRDCVLLPGSFNPLHQGHMCVPAWLTSTKVCVALLGHPICCLHQLCACCCHTEKKRRRKGVRKCSSTCGPIAGAADSHV